MKKFITVLLLFVCTTAVGRGACPERIKIFYTTYLKNILEDNSRNAEWYNNYMTEELIAKIERVGYATGADPVIRAQDANEDAIETLSVKELGNDWYMVAYLWKKGDAGTRREIPVKAQPAEDGCKITYIVPVWHGSRYGDELLPRGEHRKNEVNEASELSFLQSFYDAYTAAYCAMPPDLDSRLSFLRERYLSPRATAQFREAARENAADGLAGYDKLIDHFDFDCLWRESLRITPAGDHRYQVTYRGGDKVYRIVVSVRKDRNGYRIDGFPL